MTKAKYAGRTLLLLFLVLLLTVPAFAAPKVDLTRDVSMTIRFSQNGTAIAGAAFDLHLAATFTQQGGLTLTETFQPYNVTFNSMDNSNWATAAATLSGYVMRDKLTPFVTGKTDTDGQLRFTSETDQLVPGLYLVIGQDHLQDGKLYFSEPFLVQLPGLDPYANQWQYDLTVSPKPSSFDDPGGNPDEIPETVTRKVLKVWKDTGYTHKRPREVVVQLLKNGQVHSTVTLNSANQWRHTWEQLDKNARWTVVEQEQTGYTVSVRQEGITFVVTNTYEKPDTPEKPKDPDKPEKPKDPDKPDNPDKPGKPTPPDNPTPPDKPNTPVTPSRPTLPQTGQLWWPVPILIAAGLVLIVLGLVRRRGSHYEA